MEYLIDIVYLDKNKYYNKILSLIKKGENINKSNNDGVTILMRACIYDMDELVNNLIILNCDINITSNLGWSALMYTCINCQNTNAKSIIYSLLMAGADVNLVSFHNKMNALMLLLQNPVIDKNWHDIIVDLMRYTDLSKKDVCGKTAYYYYNLYHSYKNILSEAEISIFYDKKKEIDIKSANKIY